MSCKIPHTRRNVTVSVVVLLEYLPSICSPEILIVAAGQLGGWQQQQLQSVASSLCPISFRVYGSRVNGMLHSCSKESLLTNYPPRDIWVSIFNEGLHPRNHIGGSRPVVVLLFMLNDESIAAYHLSLFPRASLQLVSVILIRVCFVFSPQTKHSCYLTMVGVGNGRIYRSFLILGK